MAQSQKQVLYKRLRTLIHQRYGISRNTLSIQLSPQDLFEALQEAAHHGAQLQLQADNTDLANLLNKLNVRFKPVVAEFQLKDSF